MNIDIDKYIKWDEIWCEEVCIQTSIDCLNEDDKTENEIIGVIKQFQNDNDVTLDFNECVLNTTSNLYNNDGFTLTFFFSETGGQNESDTQGWSRDYVFIVNEDFMIIDAQYTQG